MNTQTYWTFREIDTELGLLKGSAFRAFKAIRSELEEGRDFLHLDHERDSLQIQSLRECGRIYRSSVQVVLLTPPGYERIRHLLQA